MAAAARQAFIRTELASGNIIYLILLRRRSVA
jgi:phage-related minor tail protein